MKTRLALQKESPKVLLLAQLDQIIPPVSQFLFSSGKAGTLDLAALGERFEKEWEFLDDHLTQEDRTLLKELLLPSEPYDLKIVEKLGFLESLFPARDSFLVCDLIIARILKETASSPELQVSPQLFIELLNFYNQRIPEFLILADVLLRIIWPAENPAIRRAVKTKACAVLINHFEIETLIIYISCHPQIPERGKQILFQSLTAFQKIYRKFLEVQEQIGNKNLISLKWFGEDFDQLKKRGEFRDSFSNLVNQFLETLRSKKKKEALQVGRFLVLRFNNEDILRILHMKIQGGDLRTNFLLTNFVYRQIHAIMQDFRRGYISQKLDQELTHFIAEMETESFESMRMITVGKVPAPLILQGLVKEIRPPQLDPLHPELTEKLTQYHLTALFDLYPVSLAAQEILLIVSQIAENLELKKEGLVKFISYLERLLNFLQQLEEMEIQIRPGPLYGIILNPFQMNSLSLIEEGAYFASTGYWLRTTIPPSLIRCINPRSIPNCLGVLDRHIFSRISLLTGAYRGTPFDLDSTNRYDWDEEPETCQIRPGYFLVDIPSDLLRSWDKTQALQKEALQEKIKKKDWT